MIATRRRFIQAAAALFCAPAIVKAENIMPVKPPAGICAPELVFDPDGIIWDDLANHPELDNTKLVEAAEARRLQQVVAAFVGKHPQLDINSDRYSPAIYNAVDDATIRIANTLPGATHEQILEAAWADTGRLLGTQYPGQFIGDGRTEKVELERRKRNQYAINNMERRIALDDLAPHPKERTAAEYVVRLRKRRGEL